MLTRTQAHTHKSTYAHTSMNPGSTHPYGDTSPTPPCQFKSSHLPSPCPPRRASRLIGTCKQCSPPAQDPRMLPRYVRKENRGCGLATGRGARGWSISSEQVEARAVSAERGCVGRSAKRHNMGKRIPEQQHGQMNCSFHPVILSCCAHSTVAKAGIFYDPISTQCVLFAIPMTVYRLGLRQRDAEPESEQSSWFHPSLFPQITLATRFFVKNRGGRVSKALKAEEGVWRGFGGEYRAEAIIAYRCFSSGRLLLSSFDTCCMARLARL